MKKNKVRLLLEIYVSFLKLGCVGFGGGYSMIPLIEREMVEEKKWVDKEKIIDIFAVAESLPGATALNSSAFVGYSIAGIPGALVALLGNMTPSVVIVLSMSILFMQFSTYPAVKAAFRGIYPVILALITYAAYKIGKTAIRDAIGIIIAVLAFIGALFFHLEPIPLIIAGAAAGIAISYVKAFFIVKKNAGNGIKGE
ncbi:MAG: chromate transporter [Clostridia bacterium]|nr:chromate transporter [Clostridia bacterium]